MTIEADYVEMEMDELNQHECMATLTALIQHMKRNKITPETEKVKRYFSQNFPYFRAVHSFVPGLRCTKI